MQANNEPVGSIKYIESPLGKLLTQLLRKITELKNKYPPTAKDTSEKTQADALMKVLEEIISLTHNKLLPYFDQKNEPGFFGLTAIGYHATSYTKCIQKLNSLLTTPDYQYFTALKDNITEKELLSTKQPLMIDAIGDFFKRKAQLRAGDGNEALFEKIHTSIYDIKENRRQGIGLMISINPSKMPLDSLRALLGGNPGYVIFEEQIFYLHESGLQKLNDLKSADSIDSLVEDIEFKVFMTPVPHGILEQKAYQNFFSTVPFNRFDFAITHPMMLELSELIINLIPQLPKQLHPLVPFLNPKALSIDLFGLEHVEGEDSSVTSYSYQIGPNKFDAAALYHQFLSSFSALSTGYLFHAMKKYRSDYSESAFVKNEHFRCSFLQEFITLEIEAIEQTFNHHLLNYKRQQFIREHKDIQSMTNDVKKLSSMLDHNIQLQQAWHSKNNAYDSSALSALLASHPVLTEKALQAKQLGLDMDFMALPLPDTLVGTTPGDPSGLLDLIPIKDRLHELMRQQWENLMESEAIIKSNLQKCTTVYEQALDLWQKQAIAQCVDFTKQQEERLTQLDQQAYEHVMAPIDDSSDEVGSLENTSKVYTEKLSRLETLKQDVLNVIKTIKEAEKLPIPMAQFDSDGSVQSVQTHQTKSMIQRAQASILKIDDYLKEHANKLNKVNHRLILANPQGLKQLAQETDSQLEEIESLFRRLDRLMPKHYNDMVINRDLLSMCKTLTQEKTQKLERLNEAHSITLNLLLSRIDYFQQTLGFTLAPWPQNFAHKLHMNRQGIDGFLTQIEMIFNDLNDKLPSNRYLVFLNEVKNCISKAESSKKIPFSDIEGLISTILVEKLEDSRGFNHFLAFLDESSSTDDWEAFRTEQDGIFTGWDYETQYSDRVSWLRQAIDKKYKRCEVHLSQCQDFQKLIKEFANFRTMFVLDMEEKDRLESQIIEVRVTEIERDLHAQLTVYEGYEKEKEELKTLKISREQTRATIHAIMGFFDGMTELNDKCSSLEIAEKDQDFESKKTELNMGLISLQEKMLQISSEINQQANLDNMRLLLNSTQQRISAIILHSQPENPVEECAFVEAHEEQKAPSNPQPELLIKDKAISNLRLKIDKIRELSARVRITDHQDADVIEQLGQTLKSQLDDFVKHPRESRNYDQFKREFTQMLHSQDPVMSKYDNLWKPILVNLIIGLFSLGIALGIKALHSKATTGRYSLFYAETDREKVIGELEQSLNIC